MEQLQDMAKVVDCYQDEAKSIVVLDRTVFYPQGGGQPYDKGVMESANALFQVSEVRFIDGVVKHIGIFEKGGFKIDEEVRCSVDRERRVLHSRLHSAGHVVDMAVVALGLDWTPGKGYHFPDGPYVEYAGDLGGLDKEKLKTEIEAACNKFVQENRDTSLVFMEKEEMNKVCHFVPDYIPEGKPARVVMYGDFGVPCGGTHVSHLGEVGDITIRKIKSKGLNVQVAYDVRK